MTEHINRDLLVRVFTTVEPDQEVRSIQWLVAAMLGAPKFNRDPCVVVVFDENGKELGRSAFGDVTDELRNHVDNRLMRNK